MQRSTDRIYTTHVGSLARPRALLDLMKAAGEGREVEQGQLAEAERCAVTDVVNRQRSAGLDVVNDGEQSKTGFYAYVRERLSGFEPRPGRDPMAVFRAEIDALPEYYEQYLKGAMTGGMVAPVRARRLHRTGVLRGAGAARPRPGHAARRSATPVPTRCSSAPWRRAG